MWSITSPNLPWIRSSSYSSRSRLGVSLSPDPSDQFQIDVFVTITIVVSILLLGISLTYAVSKSVRVRRDSLDFVSTWTTLLTSVVIETSFISTIIVTSTNVMCLLHATVRRLKWILHRVILVLYLCNLCLFDVRESLWRPSLDLPGFFTSFCYSSTVTTLRYVLGYISLLRKIHVVHDLRYCLSLLYDLFKIDLPKLDGLLDVLYWWSSAPVSLLTYSSAVTCVILSLSIVFCSSLSFFLRFRQTSRDQTPSQVFVLRLPSLQSISLLQRSVTNCCISFNFWIIPFHTYSVLFWWLSVFLSLVIDLNSFFETVFFSCISVCYWLCSWLSASEYGVGFFGFFPAVGYTLLVFCWLCFWLPAVDCVLWLLDTSLSHCPIEWAWVSVS